MLALSGVATVGGYHVAEGLGLRGMDLLLQPAHTTAAFPPSFVSGGRSFGPLGNRAGGMAVSSAMALALAGPAVALAELKRRACGRRPLSRPRRTRRSGPP